MNEMTLGTRPSLGAKFRDSRGEEENPHQFALATEIDRAIDLSCHACGAMAMGAGLGFPVGGSAALRFHPQPPIWPAASAAGRGAAGARRGHARKEGRPRKRPAK